MTSNIVNTCLYSETGYSDIYLPIILREEPVIFRHQINGHIIYCVDKHDCHSNLR